jgi:hypothetical protein
MDTDALKDDLHGYLRQGRDSLLWKLDGLSEYDVRRPSCRPARTASLVKHLAIVEASCFGAVFGRPPEPLPWWDDDAEPNSGHVGDARGDARTSSASTAVPARTRTRRSRRCH